MPITSGIGIGEAQVFDTSGLANQYARQVASDAANLQRQAIANQKKNDEFLKDLAGTVASTKLLGNGLHPEDVKQLTDYQDKTKQLYALSSQAKTPQERALLKAEVDKSIDQQLEYVNGAKYFRQAGGDLFKKMEAHPEDFEDKDRGLVKDVLSGSYINAVGKGYGVLNDTTFQRRPNQDAYVKSMDKLETFVNKGAGHDLNANSLRQGRGLQQIVRTINPKLVRGYAKEAINSDDSTKFYLKSKYKVANPDATEAPSDDALADLFIKDYEARKGPDAYSVVDKATTIPKGPATPQSEIDKADLMRTRVSGIKSLVENKDQSTLESFKSSLPAGASVSWIPKDKSKVRGNKADPKNISGMYINIPKGYDIDGIPTAEIKQQVFFDKGDPYKTINSIMNKFYGKKVPNEELQRIGVKGNVRVNKPSVPSGRKVDSGYKMNQINNGYKYIGGPAEDKNSWVKI